MQARHKSARTQKGDSEAKKMNFRLKGPGSGGVHQNREITEDSDEGQSTDDDED